MSGMLSQIFYGIHNPIIFGLGLAGLHIIRSTKRAPSGQHMIFLSNPNLYEISQFSANLSAQVFIVHYCGFSASRYKDNFWRNGGQVSSFQRYTRLHVEINGLHT